MVFPVVMYGCESWTIKKAEYRRTDAFEMWCWRRLLRVPWITRSLNQSILKEISPEYSLMIFIHDWCWSSKTLATWCEDLTHWKRPWCWKRLKEAGGEGDDRGWDGWRASPTQWTRVWENSRRCGQGSLACCSAWNHKESDTTLWLNNNKNNWIECLKHFNSGSRRNRVGPKLLMVKKKKERKSSSSC